MRLELQHRKKEQGWWESGWICERDRWKKGARKLHLQFGHASKEKLKRLIEEAYGKNERREDVEGCKRQIDEICDTCETCKEDPQNNSGGIAIRKGL